MQHRQQGSQLFLVDIPVVIAVQALEKPLGARPCTRSCRWPTVVAATTPPAKPTGPETSSSKPARPAAAKRPAWAAGTTGTAKAWSKATGLTRTARTARFTRPTRSTTFPRSSRISRSVWPAAAVAIAPFTPSTLEAAGPSFAAIRGRARVAAEAGSDFVAGQFAIAVAIEPPQRARGGLKFVIGNATVAVAIKRPEEWRPAKAWHSTRASTATRSAPEAAPETIRSATTFWTTAAFRSAASVAIARRASFACFHGSSFSAASAFAPSFAASFIVARSVVRRLVVAWRTAALPKCSKAEAIEHLIGKLIDARGEFVVLKHFIAVGVGLVDEAIEGSAALRGGLEALHRAVLAHVPTAKHHVEHRASDLRSGGFRVVACYRNVRRRRFRGGVDLFDRLLRRRRRSLLCRGSKRRGERQRETQELRFMAQRETDSHLLFPNQPKGHGWASAARQRVKDFSLGGV